MNEHSIGEHRTTRHCPLCSAPIRHQAHHSDLRTDARYRCHVCRIDLKISDATGELTVVQLDDEAASARPHCPTCGQSAAVAGPLFVEFPGTLDMVAQYFCRQCAFRFEPASSQSALRPRQ